jgi:hypothetical protein
VSNAASAEHKTLGPLLRHAADIFPDSGHYRSHLDITSKRGRHQATPEVMAVQRRVQGS